jgi:hypothetical protein
MTEKVGAIAKALMSYLEWKARGRSLSL